MSDLFNTNRSGVYDAGLAPGALDAGHVQDDYKIDYAIISSFERTKDLGSKQHTTNLFSIVLLAVFFIVMMICLAAGASMYRNVSNQYSLANDLRLQSGLLANTIRMSDAADAFEVGNGPEGPAIVLVERLDLGSYETRIYQYNGAIWQEYAVAGRPYNPAGAVKIIDSRTFEFTYDGGLISISTDEGTFDVALRSVQDGSAGGNADSTTTRIEDAGPFRAAAASTDSADSVNATTNVGAANGTDADTGSAGASQAEGGAR